MKNLMIGILTAVTVFSAGVSNSSGIAPKPERIDSSVSDGNTNEIQKQRFQDNNGICGCRTTLDLKKQCKKISAGETEEIDNMLLCCYFVDKNGDGICDNRREVKYKEHRNRNRQNQRFYADGAKACTGTFGLNCGKNIR